MKPASSIAHTAAVTMHASCSVVPGFGLSAGSAVTVSAIDYGVDPVSGVLVGLSEAEVVLERSDERAGTVHVHVPRRGFQIGSESMK